MPPVDPCKPPLPIRFRIGDPGGESETFGPKQGVIVDTGQQGGKLTVRFGKNDTQIVNITKSTRVALPGSRKGKIADLVSGVTVVVTGFENKRLEEIIDPSSIKVINAPRLKGPPVP